MRKAKVLVLILLLAAPAGGQLPLPGFGGMPVVDYAAILQLLKQLEQQVAMHELSAQQVAHLLTTVARLTAQLEQMYYNAKVLSSMSRFHSPWALWWLVSATNRYGHNAGWVAAANGATAGLAGYNASVLPMPIYAANLASLAAGTVERIQYQYDTAGLADSVAQNTLNVTGDIRGKAGQTEAALMNLHDSVLDPAASEVQVLQKISAGAYMTARTQNDTNKLLAAQAEAAAFEAKLERDRIEQAANNYAEMLSYEAGIQASTANASAIIHGFSLSH